MPMSVNNYSVIQKLDPDIRYDIFTHKRHFYIEILNTFVLFYWNWVIFLLHYSESFKLSHFLIA